MAPRAEASEGPIQLPYERANAPTRWRAHTDFDGMNDISANLDSAPAIGISGINLSLGRGAARVHILKDIDLHIGRGEAVGLVGPSGSGKSTLLMVIAGLERPDRGTVPSPATTSAVSTKMAWRVFAASMSASSFNPSTLSPP